MMLDLDMPHTVYVVVAKDKNGFRRGLEKTVCQRIYFDYASALDALRAISPAAMHYTYKVEEAVIGYPNNDQGGA